MFFGNSGVSTRAAIARIEVSLAFHPFIIPHEGAISSTRATIGWTWPGFDGYPDFMVLKRVCVSIASGSEAHR